MTLARSIAPDVGIKTACAVLGIARATFYRRQTPRIVRDKQKSIRALSADERTEILEVLYSERFTDASPAEICATLLDEGVYLCSVRTMYRILHEENAVRERRAIRHHPVRAVPRLVARGPRELWSWDITKIRGPQRRIYYQLYVILDVYSRMVVGWLLAETESGSLAEKLITETLSKEGIERDQLTLHSDGGPAMRSRTVAEMLSDLGVVKSRSRPRVSNDNPFIEAHFKTMKYCPLFPGSFASLSEAREFFRLFFAWYNEEHHHSGIAMMTPAQVHRGLVEEVVATHQAALDVSYHAHPERFPGGPPKAKRPPAEVWINRPTKEVPVNGVGESLPTPYPAENASVEPRPCSAGSPAQTSEASAEGVDGLAAASGRVSNDAAPRF